MNKKNYVDYIYDNKILIYSNDKDVHHFLSNLKAKRKLFNRSEWMLKYENRIDLANKLQILRDNNFMFVGIGHGWYPADIFIDMREKNLVTGSVVEISWTGPNQIITRIV